MHTDLLHKTLRESHHFPTEPFETFLPLFDERYLYKNEIIFSNGNVVKQLAFVLKGCLRHYRTTPEIQEQNIFFAEEGWWCCEMDSFIYYKPSTMSMQVLEDCHLLTISRENQEHAAPTIPDYAHIMLCKLRFYCNFSPANHYLWESY